MKNFFLKAITSIPEPVGSVQVPIYAGSAFVSKMSTGRYQILSNGTPLEPKLIEQEQILVQGTKGVLVQPLPPKNKGASGKAIEFEYDGSEVGLDRQQCELYLIISKDLYEFEFWKGSNQFRFHEAEVAIEVARHQINPIGHITTVLNLVEDSARYWNAINEGKIEMPSINSDGTIVTPEIAAQYSKNWNLAEEKLSELSDFASDNNLVNPINGAQYEQKIRVARVTMIAAALDLKDTKSLDRMTANQVNGIWSELIDMLNTEAITNEAVVEEPGEEVPKPEESTNIPGKSSKKKSKESSISSKPLLDPESTL
jgi:hypothetical protein